MRVYGCKQGKIGIFEIENTLEAWQSFVGGYVESIGLGTDIVLLCDEDARYKDTPVTGVVRINGVPLTIRGDFFIGRKKGSELVDITDEDIKKHEIRRAGSGE